MMMPNELLRFMSKIKRCDETNCWDWTSAKNIGGYGLFRREKTRKSMSSSHRVSYEYFKGEIGKQFVLHKCDNPSCVNPDHLFLGDQQENMEDCRQKKRTFNQKKTHCKWGHELTTENTYRYRDTYSGRWKRQCRQCQLTKRFRK